MLPFVWLPLLLTHPSALLSLCLLSLCSLFSSLSPTFFLSFFFFLLSFSFSPCFFSLLHICLLLAFHLWKLDDTTSPRTWQALSQLSYGLLFHEHRHCYFSSFLLTPSPFLFPLAHCLQRQRLKLMCNSMTPLTEVFNSFNTYKSAFFFPSECLLTLLLTHTCLSQGWLYKTKKKQILKHTHIYPSELGKLITVPDLYAWWLIDR